MTTAAAIEWLPAVGGGARAGFRAMGGACELLFDQADRNAVAPLADALAAEVWRIEARYSRYRDDSVVSRINAAGGGPVRVDAETARLLDHAATCFRLSNGRFDITSGVLRRVWDFPATDGELPLPAASAIAALLPLVGWRKVAWRDPEFVLPAGMELDFGGIGKEYAVDRAVALARELGSPPVLVNLGGDVACSAPRAGDRPWLVGTEHSAHPFRPRDTMCWPLRAGAIATSGCTRRFRLQGGRRFGHILDPRTGWPVADPPLSVSVVAATCSEAGFLSTLAMLHGREAERFIRDQGLPHYCVWSEG